MATNTPKLVLRKPAGSDNVNVVTDLNDNWDKVDLNAGLRVCTSSTRPGTPYQGQIIWETDTNNRYFWNGTSWFLMNKLIARKLADELIGNTTLQNDNHLVFGLDIGIWEIRLRAAFTGNTSADIKADYTFSGTLASHRRYNHGPAGTGGDNTNTIVVLAANVALTSTEAYAAAPGAGVIEEHLMLNVSAPGTLQWRWAQNVANAADTTVFTNSYMTGERLA